MNWEQLEQICMSIAVIGAALTYIFRGLKFAKKPADKMDERIKHNEECLDRDNKRLKKLEEDINHISKATSVLMRGELAILGHMADGNNTGEMAKMEKEIQDFLINH